MFPLRSMDCTARLSRTPGFKVVNCSPARANVAHVQLLPDRLRTQLKLRTEKVQAPHANENTKSAHADALHLAGLGDGRHWV